MIRVFPNQIVLQINVKKKEAKMVALPLLLKGQFLLSRDETKIVQLLKVSAFKYTKTCCNSLETISCRLASKEALVPNSPELICT